MSRRRGIPPAVRREVARREGIRPGAQTVVTCSYCPSKAVATWPIGVRGEPTYWPHFGRGFGLDHVIPVAGGGADVAMNLVIACGRCNTAKRDKPVEAFSGRSRINCGGGAE